MLDITASYMYNYKMRLIFLLSVKECLNFRASRGVSGALYLQSATAGMNPGPRRQTVPSAPYKQR